MFQMSSYYIMLYLRSSLVILCTVGDSQKKFEGAGEYLNYEDRCYFMYAVPYGTH